MPPSTDRTLVIIDTSVIAHIVYDKSLPRIQEKARMIALIDLYNKAYFLPDRDCEVLWVGDCRSTSTNTPYWRSIIYPGYKGTRNREPDKDWFIQRFYHTAKPLCLPYHEADDIAAAIVKHTPDRDIVLVTVDSDWLQLVTDRVSWLCAVGYNPPYRDLAGMQQWFQKKVDGLPKRDRSCKADLLDTSNPRDIVWYKNMYKDVADNLPACCDVGLIDLLYPCYPGAMQYDRELSQRAALRAVYTGAATMGDLRRFTSDHGKLPTPIAQGSKKLVLA